MYNHFLPKEGKMKKRLFRSMLPSLLFSCVFALSIPPSPCSGQADPGQNFPQPSIPFGKAKVDSDIIPGQYIVQFSEAPLAVYEGGVPNLPPTKPSAKGEKKLDAAHPDSINYLNYLQGTQANMLQSMEKELGRSIAAARTFKAAFNGVAVRMSPAEARRVAQLPGVARVTPDRMRRLHTDNGPQWIGADDLWNGTVATATKGEGIVIGVIDTGINPANPSFADPGGDGYNHANPRGRNYGFCDAGHPDYNASFSCNDKLIGAYDFTRTLPDPAVLYDNNSHGSHTASTAAGNVVNPAALVAPTITINRAISGVAPHSNLISYKACLGTGCPLSALLDAIDQATTDGVDVINYSIGGGASDPWSDPDSLAFLNARQAGVFVATSAGNDGPGSETLGSPGNSPWLLTVGSSSHDRAFVNSLTSLTRTDGLALLDISGLGMTGPLPTTAIVYAGNYGDALCLNPFAPGTFISQIVVCDRGTNARVNKGINVLAGGAGGMVLANDATNGDSINADAHVLPAVHITYSAGVNLKNWLGASSNHQAAITGTTTNVSPANGDIMSSFSSRGSNHPLPSVIKPDVSAPGQDILAANGTNNATTWGLMSGTSMASPHAAGAAALLLSLNPGWSPAEVQSALMGTADPMVLKEDGTTPATPFDTGAGRVDVSQAALAGFVLDEAYSNYLNADPSQGGDPETLNIPSLGREDIVSSTTWTRTLTSTANASWTATVVNPPGVNLTVNPASFTLAAGGTKQVSITANAVGAVFDTWLFGSVIFTPSGGSTAAARFPVALKRTISSLPSSLRYDDVRQYFSVIEKNYEAISAISNLTVSRNGLAQAQMHSASLYQDPTPDNPYDGADGTHVVKIMVPLGTKRLVTEIIETDSPDIDIYVWRWTGTEWEWHCTSASSGSNEYCSITDPHAGEYTVWIQNWEANDPSGTTLDNVEMAAAVVPEASAGNLTVSLANGGTSVPAGQSFDLKIAWSLHGPEAHWYGRFGLGTDAAHPDNLGLVDLDLHVKPGGFPWPMFLPAITHNAQP